MTLRDLKELASVVPHATPDHDNWEHLEKKYWSNLGLVSPVYGADVSGTITDEDLDFWNIAHLPSLLHDVLSETLGMQISGVNTPYLYFGTWMATFAWHTEDCELYSINYIHHGWPKQWYSIPPAYARRFEAFTRDVYRSDFNRCEAFLRHKTFMIAPNVLRNNAGVPVNSVIQEEGEMIITFPYGYHAGFNLGFNIAESTNFASERWIEFGKKAKLCVCRPDTVRINMEPFITRYQPDLLDNWLADVDPVPHPLDSMYKTHSNGSGGGGSNGTPHARTNRTALVKLEDSEDGTGWTLESNSLSSPSPPLPSTITDPAADTARVTPSSSSAPASAATTPSSGKKRRNNAGVAAMTTAAAANGQVTPDNKRRKASTSFESATKKKKNSLEVVPAFLQSVPYLWAPSQDFDIAKESHINYIEGCRPPYCSICCTVCTAEEKAKTMKKLGSKKQYQMNRPLPLCSPVLIPEMAYLKGDLQDSEIGLPARMDSPVLRCVRCQVTVHARCYGLCDVDTEMERDDTLKSFIASWKCDRCRKKKYHATCVLCHMRGGALRRMVEPFTDPLTNEVLYRHRSDLWTHVVCALGTFGVSFGCVARRLVLLPAQKAAAKQRCSVCTQPNRYQLAHCVTANCFVKMHVTCAHYTMLHMQSESHPHEFFLYCKHHTNRYNQYEKKPRQVVLHVDHDVWAKHPYNHRYYSAKLVSCSKEMLCRLQFQHDSTYCEDNPLDTIVWPADCFQDGQLMLLPDEGTLLKVKWDDDQLYDAVYLGCSVDEWNVEFETGEHVNLPRTKLFAKSENIPNRVKRLISSYGNEL